MDGGISDTCFSAEILYNIVYDLYEIFLLVVKLHYGTGSLYAGI